MLQRVGCAGGVRRIASAVRAVHDPPMQPRILVADDQADILSALKLLLKREGFEVATASSPAGVQDIVAREHVDAVVSDGSRLAALRDLVAAAEAAADREEWDAVGTADIDFHRMLISACNSTHLSAMFERLLAELRLAFLQLSDRRSLHEPYLRRNRQLVSLLEAGDREAARAHLLDYLDAAEGHLLAAVQ